MIGSIVLIQQCPQCIIWLTEYDEALSLDHARVTRAKRGGEFSEMCHSRFGIFIAFVNINRPPVAADEPLIGHYASLRARRVNHFAGELLELIKTTWLNRQLNPPGDLRRTHTYTVANLHDQCFVAMQPWCQSAAVQ